MVELQKLSCVFFPSKAMTFYDQCREAFYSLEHASDLSEYHASPTHALH